MSGRAKVLIVDDDAAGLLALETMLSPLKQELITARSGRDALRHLLDHDVAVILLDVRMPGMDGFETASAIRQRERSRHTPIVFLTAEHQAEESVARAYSVGAVDFLLKPINPEILRSKVMVFVDLCNKTETVRRQADELSQRAAHTLELLGQIEQKNRELEAGNRELEAFAHTVSHDLRAPLRRMAGFTQVLLEDHAGTMNAEGRQYLSQVHEAAQDMAVLLDGLVTLSHASRLELRREPVDLSELARTILDNLRGASPARRSEIVVAPGLTAEADPRLLRIVLENLLGNAWKFSGKRPLARIEVGLERRAGEEVYFVRDNGAGFDMAYVDRLFTAFQRLHSAHEFEGTGIGLATVQRIVARHGGRVWAEGAVDRGATFFFTLVRRQP